MKILGIETSAVAGSVALLEHPTDEVHQWRLPSDQRSAKSLAPTLHRALAEVGLKPTDLELIAVVTGPGSFTGLRVGVVTAKAMAYAVGCPVVPVNTLEVVARQADASAGRTVSAVIDAQRNELFAAEYVFQAGGAELAAVQASPVRIIAADAWLAALTAETVVTGPGLARLVDQLPPGVGVAERALWEPMADMVARIGAQAFASAPDKAQFDPFRLVPEYFRATAAEEQWARRQVQQATGSARAV